MAKLSQLEQLAGGSIAHTEIWTMAKLPRNGEAPLLVLLTLKSELWQSSRHQGLNFKSVLLTLKSELWQSWSRRSVDSSGVLLTLKSELWQSYAQEFHLNEAVLLTLKSELWQSGEENRVYGLEYCSHWNLNYGKAHSHWQKVSNEYCSHWNLNYGKANKVLAIVLQWV